jgi:hypothetical protein
MIDQRRSEASCWARLSYYTGRSHSEGLTFATDTAVYPMEADNTGRSQQPTREVVWTDEQRLPRGWLPARTATQLVTVRHRKSEARVDVTETDGQPAPRAVNRLGCRIEQLWLVDGDGKWFRASGVDNGQPLGLESTDFKEFSAQWESLHKVAALRYPSDWKGGWLTGHFFAGFVPAGTQTGDGILERNISHPLDADSRRMWVAVVDESPELQRGLSGASETPGFHVVVGQW